MLQALLAAQGLDPSSNLTNLAIESNHGHLLPDGRQVHFLKPGDYLVSADPDATDRWIVDRGFFQATYTPCPRA